MRSLWSRGRALLSAFSLMVVTPIVCILSGARLEPHCCHSRRLGSKGASAHRSSACPRDLLARAGHDLRDPGRVLRLCDQSSRPEPRSVDRVRGRLAKFRALPRLSYRTYRVSRHDSGAVWFGLAEISDGGSHIPRWPFGGRLGVGAPSSRSSSPFEPGLADVRVIRFRILVRLLRAISRGAGSGSRRRACALWVGPLSVGRHQRSSATVSFRSSRGERH
jgi:hypothetical protein